MSNRLGLAIGLAFSVATAMCETRTGAGESRSVAPPRELRQDRAALALRDTYLASVRGRARDQLPIGVFDSGTGGLAVLQAVLRIDEFNNDSHQPQQGGDGRPDFAAEQFVFLADQANMPYGNYPSAGRKEFLVELVRNDATFLLGTDYASSSTLAEPKHDKWPAKTIVIACNTATAHGKCEIESLIDLAEIDVQIVNVIDAGVQGAIEALAAHPDSSIGVIATVGTVASGAYPAAIQALARQRGYESVQVVQQGSVGLAGAIDEMPEFISPQADHPRDNYRGPAFSHPTARIRPELLTRYDFRFENSEMLWEGEAESPRQLQINSVENHVAFEVVSLLETLCATPGSKPLTAVVLGCTHFPYHSDLFRRELDRLRDYQEDGKYIYRPWIREEIRWIDPAWITARQLYQCLASHKLLRSTLDHTPARGEFFITIPNASFPGVQLDATGGFAFDYKYGRKAGLDFRDVRVVPLTCQQLPPITATRLMTQLPQVWQLLQAFSEKSPKCRDQAKRSVPSR